MTFTTKCVLQNSRFAMRYARHCRIFKCGDGFDHLRLLCFNKIRVKRGCVNCVITFDHRLLRLVPGAFAFAPLQHLPDHAEINHARGMGFLPIGPTLGGTGTALPQYPITLSLSLSLSLSYPTISMHSLTLWLTCPRMKLLARKRSALLPPSLNDRNDRMK